VYVEAFRAGLAEAGFVEGRNIFIEYRWAGNFSDLLGMAADLVSRQVAIIVVWDISSIRAAKDATSTIPIAFAYGGDPVNDGFVASLNRPGGNLTGNTNMARELAGKQLDLLLKMVSQAKTVGFLSGDRSFGLLYEEQTTLILAAGRALGVEIIIVECHSDRDFEAAFGKMVEAGVQAMIQGIVGFDNIQMVASLALLHKMPSMHPAEFLIRAGGLMSYQADIISMSRRLSSSVARILKGEKPANLPVERADRFKLAINLKTAKAIGVEVPPQLLAIADEVIEYEPPRGWNLVPTITVVSGADDPRLPLVSDAVGFWNDTFAQLGTPFRLGALTQVVGAIPVGDLRKLSPFSVASLERGGPPLKPVDGLTELPESLKLIAGNIIVALSESDISFTARGAAVDKTVVVILDYHSFPLTLPNVARNVIARQLGLSIGLSPNADPTTLMCGPPFGGGLCLPRRFASDRTEYFPLTEADKAEILRMYPKSWQASR
jgi:putative ABC transport system substrate-binding protein